MRSAPLALALTFTFLLGSFALGEGAPSPSSLEAPPSQGNERFGPDSEKMTEYRHHGPAFEHITPRMGLYTDPNTGAKVPLLPYGVFSRKDSEISKLVDYDCITFDPDFAEDLRKRNPELFYFLPENARKEKRSQESDDFCFQSTFYLPMSSLKATQVVAQKLRQAWMRLEERTFFNTYVRLNTPWSPFLYCGGLMNGASSFVYGSLFGSDGSAPIPPAVNHIPQELLPEGLGGDLYNRLLDFTSAYKLDVKSWLKNNLNLEIDKHYPGYGVPENTSNYSAASRGQFRSTYYLPFLPPPWLSPSDYCENFNLLPILYIPAIRLQVMGFTVWTSDGYPDIPMIMDEGEAEHRVKLSLQKMYRDYYPEYLKDALSLALPFVSFAQNSTPDSSARTYGNQLNAYLNDAKDILEGLNGSGLGRGGLSIGDLAQVAQKLAGTFELDWIYFPTPWQLPLLGGGAAVTPVYEYIYPDPIRSSVDLYAILDAVSTLAQSKDFTDLERLGLFLYYLQPALRYLDTPIFPWWPDSPTAGVFLEPVLNVGFSVATTLAERAANAALKVLDNVAESAFGKEKGRLFSATVKVLLSDLIRLTATTSPKMFVDQALDILRRIDSTAEAFGGGRGWWAKDAEMKHMIAPGIFRFEELKRVFPTSNPFMQHAFGYTSLFLVWDEMAAGIMPDPFASWSSPFEYLIAALSRLIGFWHLPFTINIVFYPPWVVITPDIPRYMPLAPYWIPYILDRLAWGWVNVPEGYPIPYAKGVPGALLPDVTGSDSASRTASESAKFASEVGALVMELYKKILFPEKILGGGR